MLLRNLLQGGADFNTGTTPTKVSVDSILVWVSSQIDMQFGAAGYKVPLVEVTGETWPTHQTNFLALVACLGAAAYVGGHSLKPAPAIAPGKSGGTGNLFQDLFNTELQKIFDRDNDRTHLRFRADYYAGTPAEKALCEPNAPTTDFMEGYFDPTSYLSVWDVTEEMRAVQDAMKDLDIEWDYLYQFQTFNRGFGAV